MSKAVRKYNRLGKQKGIKMYRGYQALPSQTLQEMSEQRRRTINRRNLSGSNLYSICSVARTDFEIDVDYRARIGVVFYLETPLFGNKGMWDQPGSTGSRHYLLRARRGESLGSLPETTGTCFSARGGTSTRLHANPPAATVAERNTLSICSISRLCHKCLFR